MPLTNSDKQKARKLAANLGQWVASEIREAIQESVEDGEFAAELGQRIACEIREAIQGTAKEQPIQDQSVNECQQAIDPESPPSPIVLISYQAEAPDSVVARLELRLPVEADEKLPSKWLPLARTEVLCSVLYDRAGAISENKRYRRITKRLTAGSWEEVMTAAQEAGIAALTTIEKLEADFANLQATTPDRQMIAM